MLLSWLRSAVQSGLPSEQAWRNALLHRGIGRPLLDSSKTWKEHAHGLSKHAAGCSVCRTVLKLQEERLQLGFDAKARNANDGKVRVLTREEAREDEDLIKMHPGISYDEADPSNKFSTYRPLVNMNNQSALVSLFHRPLHEDRVRLSLPLAFGQMGLHTDPDRRHLYDDLVLRKRTALSDAFFDDEDTRLQNHPIISSLIATNLPVSELMLEHHDYTFYKENPPRQDTIWLKDHLLVNKDGITIADMMLALTKWESGKDLHDRELLPFMGVEWAPWEFRDLPGDKTEDIEALAIYGRGSDR